GGLESPARGDETVRRLAAAGVDLIKVALHTGLPLLGDDELRAVVQTAHRLDLPVTVHVEGLGQAARAAAVGADALAHTPWTERLSVELITTMAARMTWITTLAIHADDEEASDIALDNLTRFHAAGGGVRYGTDMGNGPRPLGLDPSELAGLAAAGLDPMSIMDSMATAEQQPGRVSWSPYAPPQTSTETVEWLTSVRRCPTTDLESAR
ncbi:MAG: hypothetical protein L0H24_09995, partial [Microlunatus sp.]|nr:hypothetical protein [Microlunatus sp.]